LEGSRTWLNSGQATAVSGRLSTLYGAPSSWVHAVSLMFCSPIASPPTAFLLVDQSLSLMDHSLSLLGSRTPPPRAAVRFEMADFEGCIQECDDAVARGRELRADFTLVGRALARKGNALVKLGRLQEVHAAGMEHSGGHTWTLTHSGWASELSLLTWQLYHV
jgi:hypothetical protein